LNRNWYHHYQLRKTRLTYFSSIIWSEYDIFFSIHLGVKTQFITYFHPSLKLKMIFDKIRKLTINLFD